jgi:putative hydrolase of the HAD superfamily
MIKAVFFDIDDTLVDHSTAIHDATVDLYKSLNLDIAFDEFQAGWAAAHARYYPRFLRGEMSYLDAYRARVRDAVDQKMTDEAVDSLFAGYLARYEGCWTLFPDALPCLDRLQSVTLGIISNGRGVEQRRKLRNLGIESRFAFVCVSEDIGIAKPAPAIFLHACGAMGVRPIEAVYVGDQYEIDACAAREAGLDAIWLDRRAVAAATHPVQVIKTLDELPDIVVQPG